MSNFSKFDAMLHKTHKLEKVGRSTMPTNPTYFFRVFIDISV